jgi:hypothetical protein
MSVAALSKRRQAVTALIESGLWNTGESILGSVETELDRGSSEALVSTASGEPPTSRRTAWRRFFPAPEFSLKINTGAPPDKPETEAFRRAIAEAEAREIRAGNPAGAAALYAKAAEVAVTVAGRAQALNEKGRALRSSGRFEESLKIIRALASEQDFICDPAGHPFGLTAGLQVIETLRAMGRFEESGRSLVASSERLRNGAWDLTPAQAAFFEAEMDRLAAALSGRDRSSPWEEDYRRIKTEPTSFLEKG